jgi:hypothetical protein
MIGASALKLHASDPFFSPFFHTRLSGERESADRIDPKREREALPSSRNSGRRGTLGRQQHMKDRTLGLVRSSPNAPVMGLDDRAADRETHPHAFGRPISRVNRRHRRFVQLLAGLPSPRRRRYLPCIWKSL